MLMWCNFGGENPRSGCGRAQFGVFGRVRSEQAVELLLLRRQRRVVGLEPPQLGAHRLELLAQPRVLEGGGGVDAAGVRRTRSAA